MSKPLIFLDMDGVIADFKAATVKLLGEPRRDWIYDCHESYYLTKEKFIARINENGDFWRDMPATPSAHVLVGFLTRFASVFIVSDPTYCPNWNDKVEWVGKEFNIKPSAVILTPYKHLLAGPGRFLIDDYHVNINKWSEFGGLAYQWTETNDEIGQLSNLKSFFENIKI